MQLVPRLDTGGAERSCLEIGEALVANGHHSAIVCAGGSRVGQAKQAGSTTFQLDIAGKSPLALVSAYSLRKLVRTWRPDVVHVRSRLPAWIWALARIGWRTPPPTVTTLHGMHSVNRYSRIMLRAERVIAVSAQCAQYWRESYPEVAQEHVRVIDRGVDLDWFQAVAQAPLFAALPPFLLFPARGTRLKGHAGAIHLLAEITACGHDLGLVLVGVEEAGRAAYVRELKALALQLGVLQRCRFLPPVSDLRPYYSQALAMLQLSSRGETFGRTVLEALACGCPVLGYARAGVGAQLAKYFPQGMVAPDDRRALLAALQALLASALPASGMLASGMLASGMLASARPSIARDVLPSTRAMQESTLAVYQELAGLGKLAGIGSSGAR